MIEAAEASSGPPWLAIVLGVLALLGTGMVALAPALVERIKQRTPTPPADEPAPPTPVRSADLALGMVEQALRDAWEQRDEADDRAARLERERDEVRAELERYRARDRGSDAG